MLVDLLSFFTAPLARGRDQQTPWALGSVPSTGTDAQRQYRCYLDTVLKCRVWVAGGPAVIVGGGEDSMGRVCQGKSDGVQAGGWQCEAWEYHLVFCQPEQPCVVRNACAEASAAMSGACMQGCCLRASLCCGVGGTFGTLEPSITFITDNCCLMKIPRGIGVRSLCTAGEAL